MAEISYVNTVNVNLSAMPRGLSEFATNNIGLFSNEPAAFADPYKVYVGAAGVAEDFGSDSVTTQMANAIFAQSPNLRSGKGCLIVAPYAAKDATSGALETESLKAKVSAFKAIKDGEMNVVADNNVMKLTNLNFSGVNNVQDIATVIAEKNPDVYITVEGDKIKFTSRLVGKDSAVVLTKVSNGTGTDITVSAYLNAAGATKTTGTDAEDQESLDDAVARVDNKFFFGGILDTCLRHNDSIIANAKAIEAMSKKVYVVATASLNNAAVLGQKITEGGYKKTRVFGYGMTSLTEARCAAAAYLSKASCTNYSGSNTCITMNLKELATISPDTNCSDDTLAKARVKGFDIYGSTGGLGCVYSTKSAGGYMDDQTGQMAFVGALEVAAFNYLRQTNTKVPQTEMGMTGLKDVCKQVCDKFVTNGFIGIGNKWNSSEKFGDPEDFDRNISEHGYYVYSLPIAQQAQAERENREAPLIQIAAKSAGAIHIVNINGTIEA